MALRILIVDQNETWSQGLKQFFTGLQYKVTVACNGRDAQRALYNNDLFFAIILNYEVQNHSCLQVLKFIKSNHPNQRVIIVLDNPMLVASGDVNLKKLQKLGAAELAVRPFEFTHLNDLLEKLKRG